MQHGQGQVTSTSLKRRSKALLNRAGCCVKDHCTHLGSRPFPDKEAAKAGKAWAGKPVGLLWVARLSRCPISRSRLICSCSERRAGVSSLACEAVSSSPGEPACSSTFKQKVTQISLPLKTFGSTRH